MNIKTAYATENDISKAVSTIQQILGHEPFKAVIYFVSSSYDPDMVAAEMQKAFAPVPTFGCTTAGEIVSGKMLEDSIVAMAFGDEIIEDMKLEVVKGIAGGGREVITGAFGAFEKHFGAKMASIDFEKYVGIILADGLSGAEERLMEWIGDLTNVTFIGGSAGDDLKFQATHLFVEGKAYTDAAILVLIKAAKPFDIVKTQSFKQLAPKLVATKVDEQNRTVLEFNSRPATEAYAEAVGVPVETAADYFMKNPLGLMIDGEPFVRSPQQVQDSGIKFYCQILEGMELSLLESGDIVGDTKAAVEAKRKEMGSISGIVNFHCILRTLELKGEEKTEDYGKVFADVPTVGFSTYGEEYLGHINQTSTMLVFK